MNATGNIKLPPQSNDVMVNPINPENPDSKPHAAARIRLNNTQGLYNPRNPGLVSGFPGLERTSSV